MLARRTSKYAPKPVESSHPLHFFPVVIPDPRLLAVEAVPLRLLLSKDERG